MKQGNAILLLVLLSLANCLFAGTSTGKTNYAFPIIAGAILGIGLALWLKRKR